MFNPTTELPLLSVIIATYNRADSLHRCLQSVLAEPGDFFEVVIGDDASPDHTQTVVEHYSSDPRVRHYRNTVNLGMQKNYQKIARFARGEYLFILTDDDWLMAGALHKVAGVIRSHPEIGYILSHLPTVDARTGEVIHRHQPIRSDTCLPSGSKAMSKIISAAWVLSRQVWKRELLDWETWEKFGYNIFFPVIVAGRLMLHNPTYYLADNLVMHTGFNRVFWDAFGPTELDIHFNLAVDGYRCMRCILWDQTNSPSIRKIIGAWEQDSFRNYLYDPFLGFYDLLKARGMKDAFARLTEAFHPNAHLRVELAIALVQIPFQRIGVNAQEYLRQRAPTLWKTLKHLRAKVGQ